MARKEFIRIMAQRNRHVGCNFTPRNKEQKKVAQGKRAGEFMEFRSRDL